MIIDRILTWLGILAVVALFALAAWFSIVENDKAHETRKAFPVKR